MIAWDPAHYLRFGAERLRHALDLISRIPLPSPGRIYDLGCGPGTVTALLKERWPEANVTGVDSSSTMLEKAKHEGIDWMVADIATWSAPESADLVFSNAALHWLDDHETLFPRLLGQLRPGGVLAVQMPDNFEAPTHTAIEATLLSRSWKGAPELRRQPVLRLSDYHRILAGRASHLDLWRTTYLHVLEGEDPVVEWTKGSVLRPVLDALDASERETFVDGYRERVRAAYPPEPDGTTLLPFSRVFVVASAG